MAACLVCNGEGRLLWEACPLCDGVIGWPEEELGHVMGSKGVDTLPRGSMPIAGISFLSWNLFNPDTIGLATKENPHYNHLSDEERFWEHRWPKILGEIRVADAAVVCLQEINTGLFGEIKDALAALGYASATHKRMQRNSLAIFWKQRLTKVWEKQVKIKGFEKTLAVGLEDAGRVVAVVTCHLEGHPQKSCDRLSQLEKTLAEIKGLHHDALVIAGDFNAPLVEEDGRSSAVTSYMSVGAIPQGTTEWGTDVVVPLGSIGHHGYELESAYSPGPAFSIALHGEGPALIDHMWFSHSLELTGVRDVFFKGGFRGNALQRGLPNDENPSDHLPLGAVLKWR